MYRKQLVIVNYLADQLSRSRQSRQKTRLQLLENHPHRQKNHQRYRPGVEQLGNLVDQLLVEWP